MSVSLSNINNQNQYWRNITQQQKTLSISDKQVIETKNSSLSGSSQKGNINSIVPVKDVTSIGSSIAARSPSQEEFLGRVQGWSDDEAQAWLSDITSVNPSPSFDIRDSVANGGKIKLSSTGREFDSYEDMLAYENQFENIASDINAGRKELYNTEMKKGTPPKIIIEKLIDYDNSQSTFYREAIGAGFGKNGNYRDYVLNPIVKSEDNSMVALKSGKELITFLDETNSYIQNRLIEHSN